MTKAIKIFVLFTIFSIMISSVAAAAFTNIQAVVPESANMMMLGIALISLGSFLRVNFKKDVNLPDK